MTNLNKLFNLFSKNNLELFQVGGCVRDMLLGKTPKDIDLVSNALPDKIQIILSQLPGWKVLEVGEAFGIIFVVAPDGEQFEIASFRSDTEEDGRKCSVTLGVSIEDDVKRRDFTINAMFLDASGNIVDLVGGKEDIKNKMIRCVGNPNDRFTQDQLRKLRAIRFASNLGFEIEESTMQSIIQNPILNKVSKERIFQEFSKVKNFEHFQKLLDATGLGKEIFGDESHHSKLKGISTIEEFLAFNLKNKSNKFLSNLEVEFKIPSKVCNRVRILIELAKNPNFNVRKVVRELKNDAEFFGQFKNPLFDVLLNFEPKLDSTTLVNQGVKGKEFFQQLQESDLKQLQEEIQKNGR